MKYLVKIAFLFAIAAIAVSCHEKGKPNFQYMPNMYEPVPYETNGRYDVFPNGMEAMQPAEGTVKRGWMPYEYENSTEGYASAKANLKNPLPYTEDNYNKGKALFTIYCAVCHGDKGDGQGILAEREKVLGVPAYNDAGRAITEGSVYHVTYYGLNTMGSYATQTTEKELWQINHYVMSLKDQLDGKPERPFVGQDESDMQGGDTAMSAETEDGAEAENMSAAPHAQTEE
ncbi:MAG: cytochrome C [Cytophagaceae bacterium]|nr:cytochrome C [Cytophagaceae bacterium]